jgi:translation initiation factor eIF-2B subunit alpha/methylthioribose-1-phosphate isomerase
VKVKTETGYLHIKTVELLEGDNGQYEVRLIDQRYLPHKLVYYETHKFEMVKKAISEMVTRGAPAIGVTAAYSIVIGLQERMYTDDIQISQIDTLIDEIMTARPTARDLESFVKQLINRAKFRRKINLDTIATIARDLAKESEDECLDIGLQSKHLIKENMGILTHCNAGALATVDHGTALSPMRQAHQDRINFKVYVDETRPRLQGVLTGWELYNEGIEHTLIVDNAAGYFMQKGVINLVITGCDRVLSDGTVTNKIGTLEKAVLAKTFDIPFYVAMPWTTYDPVTSSAFEIPIEFRSEDEIRKLNYKNGQALICPEYIPVSNPAFDITPPEFITGYITKNGILKVEELLQFYDLWKNEKRS